MEGTFQPSDMMWQERQSTVLLTLSESSLLRWAQVAREENITDNSTLALLLLQQYENSRSNKTAMCTACGTSLSHFCAACFTLVPKSPLQISSTLAGLLSNNIFETSFTSLPSQSQPATITTIDNRANDTMPAPKVSVGDDDDDDDEGDDNNDVDSDDSHTKEAVQSDDETSTRAENISKSNTTIYGESTLKGFTCYMCSQSFLDPDQFVQHVQTHTDSMEHECRQCGAKFFQPCTLQLHIDTHCGQKKHVCDPSNASFSTMHSLVKRTTFEHERKLEARQEPRTISIAKTLSQDTLNNLEKLPDNLESDFQDYMQRDKGREYFMLCRKPGPSHSGENSFQLCHDIPREIQTTSEAGVSTLSCNRSGRHFTQKQDIERHCLPHSGEETYGCQQCGAAFPQLSSLGCHMATHLIHTSFLCETCHIFFSTQADLTMHKCQERVTLLPCTLCGEKFETSNQAMKHVCHSTQRINTRKKTDSKSTYQPVKEEIKNYKLPRGRRKICTTLKQTTEVSSKNLRGAKKTKRNKCTSDSRNNNSVEKSTTEPQVSSEDDKARAETLPHCCQFCGACFMLKDHLTRHLQDHTGEKDFKCVIHSLGHSGNNAFPCQYCGKVLKSVYTLKEHLRSHTGERPFICDTCGACFTLSSTYKAHQRTHSGDRPYLCPHCGKSFVRSSNLSVHIRVCTGERPYTCPECGKSFSDVGYYKKHVNNHAGIKPYKCEYCAKAFSQSTSLKLHIRIHTGEKPYQCSECSMAFAIPSSLKEHQRKHSGDKPYKCSVCGKGFAKSCNRLAHFRTHKTTVTPMMGSADRSAASTLPS